MESEKDISGKIQALHNKAKLLLQQDYSEDQVIARLQQDGVDAQYAMTIIENLKTDDENRAHFRSLLILGLSTTIGGDNTEYSLLQGFCKYPFIHVYSFLGYCSGRNNYPVKSAVFVQADIIGLAHITFSNR